MLLILAVVAIGAVQNDGIISHAKNAREEYGAAGVNENATIQSYLDKIQQHVGTGSGVASGTGGNETIVTEVNFTNSDFSFKGDKAEKTASIIGKSNESLSVADVVFPSTVVYNGDTYTVTEIGANAFNDSTEITSIVIPESITLVRDCAFIGCSNLASVTWKAKDVTAKDSAFANLTKLTSFTFEEGLKRINFSADEMGALNGCTNLKNITIPATVETISMSSFRGTGLTEITIPASVTNLGFWCFKDCTALTDIYCEPESKPSGWDTSWNESSATVHWNVISFKIDGTEYKAQRGMKWSQWIDSTEYNSKDFSYTTYQVHYDLDTLIVVDENSTIVNPESEIGSGGTYKLSA